MFECKCNLLVATCMLSVFLSCSIDKGGERDWKRKLPRAGSVLWLVFLPLARVWHNCSPRVVLLLNMGIVMAHNEFQSLSHCDVLQVQSTTLPV